MHYLQLKIGVTALLLVLVPATAHATFAIKSAPSNGLVGWWTFDNADVTDKVYDRSGYGQNGYFVGAATSSSIETGMLGQAINFISTNNGYIDVGTASGVLNPQVVTVSAWVRPKTSPQVAYARIAEKLYSSSYYLGTDTTGTKFKGIFANGTSPFGTLESVTTITPGVWYHVVATHDGANDYLYINGVREATQANTATINDSTHAMRIGNYVLSNTVGQWNGDIDDVRIYNRALSAAEVVQLYNSQQSVPKSKSPPSSGLVGWWTLDSTDVADKIYDRSGQGNNSYFNGGATSTAVVRGNLGQALNFNGINQYMQISSAPPVGSNKSFTYSLWINVRSYTNGGAADGSGTYFIDRTTSTLPLIDLKTVSDNYCFQKRYDDNTGIGCISTTSGVDLNKWTHIVLIRDYNNNFYIYKNGIQEGSVADTGGKSLTAPVPLIGGSPQLSSFSNSSIDDVRIYNRALSAAEVTQLYNSQQSVPKTNTSQTNKLPNGLVGYWSFNNPDISGVTAYDRSGQGNNGTLVSGPLLATGRIGQALSFDGVASYVTTPLTPLPSSFSVSMWAVPSSLYAYSTLWSNDGSAAGCQGEGLYFQDSFGQMNYRVAGTDNFFTPSPVMARGKWAHIVTTYSSSEKKVYINGISVFSTNSGGAPNGNVGFQIGNYNNCVANVNFTGKIDEVRIYNRALSPDEVKRLYNLGR